MTVEHVPCLRAEVLRILNPQPGECFVDCTISASLGHAMPIAQAIGVSGLLIGIDLDVSAIEEARAKLQAQQTPFYLFHGNFVQIAEFIRAAGVEKVNGIIADLGTSIQQLKNEDRGFSFSAKTRPDMRMDGSSEQVDAWEILQAAEEQELARILWEFGEERYSRKIARAIVRQRVAGRLQTCEQLADLVERIYPRGPHRIHPATRTFQALRIAVNRELENLDRFLPLAFRSLKLAGKLGLITYHSKEAAVVKRHFRRFAGACTCPPGIPVCVCGAREEARLVTGGKPVVASQEEIENNPRCRSSQLRVVQRVKDPLRGASPG